MQISYQANNKKIIAGIYPSSSELSGIKTEADSKNGNGRKDSLHNEKGNASRIHS